MSIKLPFPDKYIRKALYSLLNGIVVDGHTINVYDGRVSGSNIPSHYILISTQTNNVNQGVKCGNRWESSVLLDIFTRYIATGNTGSRLLADDIVEAVRALLENDLILGGGLNVIDQTLDFPNDLITVTDNENVFRKFIRIELLIN